MKSRFRGRNPTFRPCHRPVTPMDVLDSDGGIGQDLHVTSIDRKGRTCLFRPLLIFCLSVFNLSVNNNHPFHGGIFYFYPHFIHRTSVSVPVPSIAIPGTGRNAFLYRQ